MPSQLNKKMIVEAQNGDAAAQQELITHCTPLIERECEKLGLARVPAITVSDLTQEVKIHIISKLGSFAGEKNPAPVATFKSWASVVTRNFLLNFIQKQQRSPNAESIHKPNESSPLIIEDTKMEPISANLRKQEDANLVREAIKKILDEDSRSILRMKIVQGTSFVDIAKQLDMSVDQVRYRYQQALTKLKTHLHF
jgi:RNA polymerase sigma factor (sigma-70 family)